MSKSSTPQIFFILAALTLAAGTGATIFQWSEIGDKTEQLAQLKKDVRDPKDIQAEFDQTSTKVAESKANLDHLEQGVPAFAYVPTMLKELETFGKQNGIEVLGVRPIPKPETKDKYGKRKKEAYEEIAIEVKGRGNFKSVKSFITALEKFPKIVSARSVSMQPNTSPQSSGPAVAANATKKLDVTVELRAFLFSPNRGEEKSPHDLAAGVAKPAATSQATPPAGPNTERGNSAAAVTAGAVVVVPPAAKVASATSVPAKQAAKPATPAPSKSVSKPAPPSVKVASKPAAPARHLAKRPVRRFHSHRKYVARRHFLRRRARR